jgi:hypothetical protein
MEKSICFNYAWCLRILLSLSLPYDLFANKGNLCVLDAVPTEDLLLFYLRVKRSGRRKCDTISRLCGLPTSSTLLIWRYFGRSHSFTIHYYSQ